MLSWTWYNRLAYKRPVRCSVVKFSVAWDIYPVIYHSLLVYNRTCYTMQSTMRVT